MIKNPTPDNGLTLFLPLQSISRVIFPSPLLLLLWRGRLALSKRTDQVQKVILLLLVRLLLGLSGFLLSLSSSRILLRSRGTGIEAAAETRSESSESTSLIVLNVHKLAARRVPQERVAGITRRAVHRHGRGGAVGERAAVGERDELGEGVGALRAAEKGSVSALGADEGCRFGMGGGDLAGGEDGAC